MLNVVTSTQSIVYKRRIGTDATFVSLFTSASTEPFDFAVANNHVFFCNGTDMQKYDGTTVSNWGITAPSAAVSISLGAGAITATAGYQYVICWENQTTGHISSPSPISALTVPVLQDVTITGSTTTDAQVTHVRIYRTADGGSIFFEHPSSPVTYATWTGTGLVDSTANDELLGSAFAPLQNQNNPPVASKGPVWFAGRLWTFAGDTVYYSGWEEIPIDTSDAPEECFPIDNFFPFGQEVIGLATTTNALLVICAGTIFKITGDTLDSFKRDTLANRRGTRNRATVTSNGKICAWLESSNTIQYTDSVQVQELSLPIRNDISSIDHAQAAMTFHDDGLHHWLVLMDGGAGKLRIYDQDKEQWMPPWTITGLTAIHSGEVAAGTLRLMAGRSGRPVEMSLTTYADEGNAYAASLTTGLSVIAEEASPDSPAYVDYISLERDSNALSDVSLLVDDDPISGTFTSLFGNEREPPFRTNGVALLEKQYPTERGPVARRASVKFDWPATTSNFALYSYDLAYKEKP
jgi:hypothetical protein